jgi:hypothetical protein
MTQRFKAVVIVPALQVLVFASATSLWRGSVRIPRSSTIFAHSWR